MRKIRVLFVLSAVLMLLFSVASPVMADPSDTVRVWVSYREGGKSLRHYLQAAPRYIMIFLNLALMLSVSQRQP